MEHTNYSNYISNEDIEFINEMFDSTYLNILEMIQEGETYVNHTDGCITHHNDCRNQLEPSK